MLHDVTVGRRRTRIDSDAALLVFDNMSHSLPELRLGSKPNRNALQGKETRCSANIDAQTLRARLSALVGGK